MKPQSIWHPSHNYSVLTSRKVSVIVLHATATAGLQSPLDWLCSSENHESSAHYLLGTDGALYHLVLDENVSWHAGASKWKGREWVNTKTGKPSINCCSIGIEMVNDNTGKMVYPEAQVAKCAELVRYLMGEFGVLPEDVVSHADVAVPAGRKNDPLGFDMDGFRKRLEAI